ncbi:VOC family protein [Pseudophaeobacter sp.]|uniref:VOC family protein n=1 Tax=Pseudophaeobacter sp. TaxID=1971739 RepID=UPI00329A3E56
MELDHLAVAGTTLEEATAHVEEALGVPLQPGGQHAMFGTHNRLLGLADGLYLEAIAIDPKAQPQRQPCWFDLDRFSGPPRISNWICRCLDLPAVLSQLPKGAGEPVALTRGDLKWDMAVPADGILPFDNLFPALIEWHSDHPAPRLQQQGCSLHHLTLSHPEAVHLQKALPLTDARLSFVTGPVGFEAEFDTPHGRRLLR